MPCQTHLDTRTASAWGYTKPLQSGWQEGFTCVILAQMQTFLHFPSTLLRYQRGQTTNGTLRTGSGCWKQPFASTGEEEGQEMTGSHVDAKEISTLGAAETFSP